MRKVFKFLLVLFLLFPFSIYADRDKVELFKCVDGDTARFIYKKQEIKVRFLGINAPETEKDDKDAEPYGEDSANYVCRKLKNAKKIELEYDKESDKTDKYDRTLAYVFLDDKLLEVDILKKGYATVKYAKKSFKYYDDLVNAEEYAKEKKHGIYSDKEYIVSKEEKKNIVKSVTKYIKKLISNVLREIFD